MPCNDTSVHFTVQLDKQTITLDHSTLLFHYTRLPHGFCGIYMRPMREYGLGVTSGYENLGTWVLGSTFTDLLCLAYDYGVNKLGLGFPKRKWIKSISMEYSFFGRIKISVVFLRRLVGCLVLEQAISCHRLINASCLKMYFCALLFFTFIYGAKTQVTFWLIPNCVALGL